MRIAVFGHYSDALPVVRDALSERGWEVQTFEDGGEAAAALSPALPDLILVDSGSFDGETGWELLSQLKSDDSLASVPVIVSSHNAYELRGHDELLQEGVAAVLVLPCSREDVLRCVDAAMAPAEAAPDVEIESVATNARVYGGEPQMEARR